MKINSTVIYRRCTATVQGCSVEQFVFHTFQRDIVLLKKHIFLPVQRKAYQRKRKAEEFCKLQEKTNFVLCGSSKSSARYSLIPPPPPPSRSSSCPENWDERSTFKQHASWESEKQLLWNLCRLRGSRHIPLLLPSLFSTLLVFLIFGFI